MRLLRVALVIALAAGTSCSSDVDSSGLAINDPLALIDDIEGPLRLFVLPGASYTCDATTGMVSPEVPDVAEGMLMEAVADLSLTVMGSSATTNINVPGGDYTVLVRGKGTDPVSMRTDVFIATGCAASTIADGDTREVRITLLPILGMGVCGDGTLSPDEQCEDSNTTDGDGCSATCRTESFQVNTTTTGTQNHPTVGGATGQRWTVAYDSENATSILRTLQPDGSAITTPSVLMNDTDIDDAVGDIAFGAQLLADVAVSSAGDIAMGFVDFNGGPSDVRVVVFDSSRAVRGGASILIVDGVATVPSVAFSGGTIMVVYEDTASATGLMGAVIADGATTAGTPFEVGTGLSSASAPDIAGTSSGFVVAMTAGGDVHYQGFGTDGTPRDASAMVVSAGSGVQDQPAIGAQASGEFVVVWRDELLDGGGTGIGARAFDAAGAPAQDPFVLNSETAGAQADPAVASGNGTFAVIFTSGGAAHARLLSVGGDPVPNQEMPPTTADFVVADSASEVAAAAGGSDTRPVWMAVTHDEGNIHARFFPFF